jgi:hypothetical protein
MAHKIQQGMQQDKYIMNKIQCPAWERNRMCGQHPPKVDLSQVGKQGSYSPQRLNVTRAIKSEIQQKKQSSILSAIVKCHA